jgi:16S rRNA (guanine527-N7)-methyltransferase
VSKAGAKQRLPRPICSAAEFAAVFNVSGETIKRLTLYEALIHTWQKAIHLVGASTVDALWSRHFSDSAQLLALAPDAKSWLDLGSGGGFPGLVIAILGAASANLKVTLIESDQRKVAFLRDVARQTRIAVDILPMRIERAATHARLPPVDVVSARALAPLDKLLVLAAPFFATATVGLFPKGRNVRSEVARARQRWAFDAELVPSITAADARIAVIRHPRALGVGEGGGLNS